MSEPLAGRAPTDQVGKAGVLGTHAALLVVQMAFAGGAVEGKLAMRASSAGGGGVEPLALAMARIVGAALFFQVLARLSHGLRPLPWREHARIAGFAILGIAINQTLYLIGLHLTTSFAAALLSVTIPVFAATLAVAFRVERARAQTAIGLGLAITGVLGLTGFGSLDVGALVIAVNCLSYALYIVLSRASVQRVGALPFVTWLFTWGLILMFPLGIVPFVHGLPLWSPRAWALVGFMVFVPTILAYLANAWALGRSSPTLVTVYIYVQPILAAALQWLQLGEPIARRAIGASVFIVTGVATVAYRRSRPEHPSKADGHLPERTYAVIEREP